jgi:hypothetical protein
MARDYSPKPRRALPAQIELTQLISVIPVGTKFGPEFARLIRHQITKREQSIQKGSFSQAKKPREFSRCKTSKTPVVIPSK